jgi:hypothetical protein
VEEEEGDESVISPHPVSASAAAPTPPCNCTPGFCVAPPGQCTASPRNNPLQESTCPPKVMCAHRPPACALLVRRRRLCLPPIPAWSHRTAPFPSTLVRAAAKRFALLLTLPGYEIMPPQRIVEGASATSHDPAHPPENVLDERDGELFHITPVRPVSESRGQVIIATCADTREWLCVAGKWWVTTGGYPQLLVIRFKQAVQVDRVSQGTQSRHRLWCRRVCP